jgi:uncharacterized membrane protein YfcA
MSAALLVLVAAAVLATSFVSGILGMAGGMMLMGVLIAAMPLPQAMMLHGIVQLAANGWRAAMLRGAIDWRIARGYVLGALVAFALFSIVRPVLGKATALLLLGLSPFVGLALPERLRLDVERRGHSFACGLACGALALACGISGPLLDLFFVRSQLGRRAVVATKALTQSFTHLSKIAYFGGMAGAGETGIAVSASMVLLAFAGTSLSRRVLDRMDDRSFRAWTRWTLRGLGAAFLAGGVHLLLK